MTVEPSTLYVVGTPIGNLGDLSLRAAATLRTVDAVVCEDTRRTGKLLAHIRQLATAEQPSVAEPDQAAAGRPDLLVANEHTEYRRIPEVLDRLGRGQALALVTDAGMPMISDPGRNLVVAVVDAGFPVEVVPGPTAMSAALVVSGLPTERFAFEGFLPRKGRQRRERLAAAAAETRTMVFYEAPHRLLSTLRDLAAVCGAARPVAIGRELTKLHEEVIRTTLGQAAELFASQDPRGEFVIVMAGVGDDNEAAGDDELQRLLRDRLDQGSTTRDAVAAVVATTGEPKRRVYELATALVAGNQSGPQPEPSGKAAEGGIGP